MLLIASYMGAWIEILQSLQTYLLYKIASYMGAWIEMRTTGGDAANTSSHPIWVRGLKSLCPQLRNLPFDRILYGCVD